MSYIRVSEILVRTVIHISVFVDGIRSHIGNFGKIFTVPNTGLPVYGIILPHQHKLGGSGWIHLIGEGPRSRIPRAHPRGQPLAVSNLHARQPCIFGMVEALPYDFRAILGTQNDQVTRIRYQGLRRLLAVSLGGPDGGSSIRQNETPVFSEIKNAGRVL